MAEKKKLTKKNKVEIFASIAIFLLFAVLIIVLSSHHTHIYNEFITEATCTGGGIYYLYL